MTSALVKVSGDALAALSDAEFDTDGESGEEAEFTRPSGRVSLGKRTQRGISTGALRSLLDEGTLSLDQRMAMAKFEVGRADKLRPPDVLAGVVRYAESAALRVTPTKVEKANGLMRATEFLSTYGLTLRSTANDSL